MALGFLTGHMRTQHGREVEGRHSWEAAPLGEEPWTYRMTFPTVGGPRNCLGECCPGRTAMRTAMWLHFLHRHVRDTVVILEGGKPLHPLCPRCDMLVPWHALNGKHLATAQYARGAKRKQRRLAED